MSIHPPSDSPFGRIAGALKEGARRAGESCVRPRALLAAAAAVALVGGSALPATLGGSYHASVGSARVVLPRSGIRPATLPVNLRLDLAGAPGDTEGTGTVRAYDEAGQWLLGEFPCAWTTGKGAAFRLDLAGDGFRAWMEDLVEGVVGSPVEVTVDRALGRGVAKPSAFQVRLQVQVRGTCSIDGGEPGKLKTTMRLQ